MNFLVNNPIEYHYKYFPKTKKELIEIIKDHISEREKACDLNDIDTSEITDMSFLFSKYIKDNIYEYNINMKSLYVPLNVNISEWNVSNVTSMESMFEGSNFDNDISAWDVSNVENMDSMFKCTVFDQDISSWNVSKVKSMIQMFACSEFNQDISSWNVSNVINMDSMFCFSRFNKSISDWDVSNVKHIDRMFAYSEFNQDISSWKLENLETCNDFNKESHLKSFIL